MTITVPTQEFKQAIARLPKTSNLSIGILSYIKVQIKDGYIELSALSGVSGAVTRVAVTHDKDYDFCVSAPLLSLLVNAGKDEFKFKIEDSIIKQSYTKIPIIDGSDFPQLPTFKTNTLVFSEEILAEIVMFSKFTAEDRGILDGVNLSVSGSKLTMYATDSHRLLRNTFDIDNPDGIEFSLTMSTDDVMCLKTFKYGAEIGFDVNSDSDEPVFISFESDENSFERHLFYTAVIQGAYPKVEPFFENKLDATGLLDSKKLTNIINSVKILDPAANNICFKQGYDGQVLVGSSNEKGDYWEEMDLPGFKKAAIVAFSPKYLSSLSVKSEWEFSLNYDRGVSLFTKGTLSYGLMPVQLRD